MSEQPPTIEELFSAAPASLVFSTSTDGWRRIGTSAGFVLDCWSDRVEAAAIFPPDNLDLAARNATLLQLLLAAMRPDWQSAAAWLEQQLRLAARDKRGVYEYPNISRRVRFAWDRRQSRATLKVQR